MDEPLVTIGFPAGVPLKIDDGGRILAAAGDGANYATASIDDIVGSSGGPVLDAQGALLGLALGGRADFTSDQVRGCSHTAVVSGQADVTQAEHVGPIARMLRALCASQSAAACQLLGSAHAHGEPQESVCSSSGR